MIFREEKQDIIIAECEKCAEKLEIKKEICKKTGFGYRIEYGVKCNCTNDSTVIKYDIENADIDKEKYSKDNLLITTTSTIQGHLITDYKGLVTARVVTGTNFFSDFCAGATDFLGGRTSAYQRQLKSINDEVIRNLKEEAIDAGANAIVGVSIDHDEISGKGKQMFMVTAIGTAVSITRQTLIQKVTEKV